MGMQESPEGMKVDNLGSLVFSYELFSNCFSVFSAAFVIAYIMETFGMKYR